jgi:lipid II:glycine glycyltransferase (peptidoglycan interpeptide bridge formation enzyme)
MKDIRQTKEYAEYLSQTGWVVENLHDNFYFIKKLPLLGSFIKLQRPEKVNLEDIKKLKKKHRAFRVIIEPKEEYKEASTFLQGFTQSKTPFLPTKTLQIDLRQTEKEIYDNFKSDARAAIKRTKSLEPLISNTDDFHNAWKKQVKSRFLLTSKKELEALGKAFGENCLLLQYEDSGAIFLKAENIVYYWKAFTSPQGRADLVQYKIVYEGILWGKKRKAKIFDFEGIYDERFPLKNWKGFTHFKKSFGGKEVSCPGAFIQKKSG